MSADLERDEGLGLGTRKMGVRGSCRAEMTATGDWRIANSEQQIATGETAANGEQ
jgi:hypothetical protein